MSKISEKNIKLKEIIYINLYKSKKIELVLIIKNNIKKECKNNIYYIIKLKKKL